MQQRRRRAPSQPIRNTEEDFDTSDEFEDNWPTRMPSSARRYRSTPDVRKETARRQSDELPTIDQRYYGMGNTRQSRAVIPSRTTATQGGIPSVAGARQRPVYTDDILPHRTGLSHSRQGFNFHWLLFVGIAMVIMIIGWVAFNALGSWWQTTQDDWHYGRPRTYQTDAVVGHNDSAANPSHFIATNLHRHVIIVELPGGDATKARIFNGPILIGPGQDLAPVTLTFQDVNGDGLPDMIVNVQDAHFVFINTKGTFQPAKSN